jgi:DNA-binding HxlR family transcriptional regulator
MYPTQERCSIARSLQVLGERWTLLVVREAFFGTTKFADFRDALGVAPDILSARLKVLVDAGVLERRAYREPGRRERHSYHLTAAGQKLRVVLAALQQWGDEYCPSELGPSVFLETPEGGPAHVGFVDPSGAEVAPDEVQTIRVP